MTELRQPAQPISFPGLGQLKSLTRAALRRFEPVRFEVPGSRGSLRCRAPRCAASNRFGSKPHTAGFIGSDFQKNVEAQAPLGRIGQPEDVAKVAVFLASDESSWLTGERISASGGHR